MKVYFLVSLGRRQVEALMTTGVLADKETSFRETRVGRRPLVFSQLREYT